MNWSFGNDYFEALDARVFSSSNFVCIPLALNLINLLCSDNHVLLAPGGLLSGYSSRALRNIFTRITTSFYNLLVDREFENLGHGLIYKIWGRIL